MNAPRNEGQDTNLAFVNTYHNARTEIQPTERPEIKRFLDATDGVLAQAAELARVVASAHQGAATQMIGGDWSQARKYFSLSEKYAAWADYHTPAVGFGIHAYIAQVNQPMRLTQAELEAHAAWKNFGVENGKHPPMRGWLAVPLLGSDGLNYGLLQVSDRYEGDFTAEDEAKMTRLTRLTSQALDALAMVSFPDYRDKWAGLSPNDLA
jgi:GAF domain-containing protein